MTDQPKIITLEAWLVFDQHRILKVVQNHRWARDD